jgi:hypothetical protein
VAYGLAPAVFAEWEYSLDAVVIPPTGVSGLSNI